MLPRRRHYCSAKTSRYTASLSSAKRQRGRKFVFKDLGIKSRVLMLTLLPTSLLALVLGGYFTWAQLSDLQAELLQRGQMIAEQLAPLAAPADLLSQAPLRRRRTITQLCDLLID
jgi:hypothetical protein